MFRKYLRDCSTWLCEGAWQLLNNVPGNCSLCRQICRGTSLCWQCQQALPWLRDVCPRCALAMINRCDAPCGYCATRPPAVDRCIAPLRYADPVDRLISSFKFHARFCDGRSLALLLAGSARRAYAEEPLPELLLPMPLHRDRWRQRGYNQAMEIARVVGRDLNLPLCATAVSRRRATAPQTSLQTIAARRRNVSGAFIALRPEQIQGVTHVAIVDDVITTMATVNALAACLRQMGIPRVDAWCLARASRRTWPVNSVISGQQTEQLVNNEPEM